MNALEVLDRLAACPDGRTAARMASEYGRMRRRGTEPVTVARAAVNQGFALAFTPGAGLARALAPIRAGLAELPDPLERVRVHYELAQLLTRMRKESLYRLAEEHYQSALADLQAAEIDLERCSFAAAILNGRAWLAYLGGRYDEAVGLEQRALLCLRRLPGSPSVWLQRMEIALRTGDVFRKRLHEYANARHFYRTALRYARRTGNPDHVTLAQVALDSLPRVGRRRPG